MRTLLLDNSFFPVRVINWQRAMILLLTGKAQVVTEYDDKIISSPTKRYNLPKILRLFNHHKHSRHVKFTRLNVFTRDNCTCQYCAKRFNMTELTFDHVIPSSRGGGTNWENIVTCCQKCNNKKGNKTPKEARMKLLAKPETPNWSAKLCLKLKQDDPEEWNDWLFTYSKTKMVS